MGAPSDRLELFFIFLLFKQLNLLSPNQLLIAVHLLFLLDPDKCILNWQIRRVSTDSCDILQHILVLGGSSVYRASLSNQDQGGHRSFR